MYRIPPPALDDSAQGMGFKSMFPNWSTHFHFITSETGKGNGIGCNILDMFPLFHSQLIARLQDSSCKQVFMGWHVDLKLYVGSLQTCSIILLSAKSGARKRCIIFTPWSRVFENLTGSQLVKKYPAFYGTRRFITAFTSARHLSLS